MMFNGQGFSRDRCNVLAVVCDDKHKQQAPANEDHQRRYPFPELSSSGRLKVQVLKNPSPDELGAVLESSAPEFVYLQGEQRGESDEVGPLGLGYELSTPDTLVGIFGSMLPTTVYLEVPNGEELAEALYSKGVPYVIYWKGVFSKYAACHFRHALFSVMQSSYSHTWDAFRLAEASFRLYCTRNNAVLLPSNSDHIINDEMSPCLLGDPPKIDVVSLGADEQEEENSLENLPSIKIYDEDVTARFLLCGPPCIPDSFLLGPLEDGLNALLRIEMRGSKLHNRSSAPPPPLQAGTFTRGVVTMRCDISTCSSAHISLLVSGSAQTCFSDQLLENHIKHELVEKSQLVNSVVNLDETKPPCPEPRRSASIACGASVFEVSMKVPAWALQVLRQIAPDASYRSLVILGVASIQGLSVASFEKEDAERLLFFCTRQRNDTLDHSLLTTVPQWLVSPLPSRKRPEPGRGSKEVENGGGSTGSKINVAAMRPIPHTRRHKMIPFSGYSEVGRFDGSDQAKANLPSIPPKHGASGGTPLSHRKAFSGSYQKKQIISLNPLPLKKHDCGRAPIQICPEEEFLRDVMQFLLIRGHTRLVPQGGIAEFPDAVLNSKRLDLFNLYREVVSRGGFHVGNGINWKGQVFSKMRNHTLTNRMTGVGNTLKRHYETYLLEYEYAHDDVDGECCLICRSSTAGDWVNCGACGEWAHFGCDRRPGLGAFKDYAKTDGLEYVCPSCSVTHFRKKAHRTSSNGLALS
ncbi:PREDICTED: AT-rich interactive domain-containing protein 4 [Tarenaya hassleriana]|uniref:AT-rich interactive domain-containing protein 4 n=1 Tax=Tarenaya hassleriana TaxID=28532 RepID=UPI00053C6B87|nr:PREDICTED: AT-rich interactive domain-containing protein 4 [Tarenaya hassleriana]